MRIKKGKGESILQVICVIVLAIFVTSCMIMPAGIAPSTTPITANDTYTELGKASGSAWGVNILGLPLAEMGTVTKAVERAKADTGADALIDVGVEQQVYQLFFITIFRTYVEGTAVKIKRGAR
jgi:hypothetical protein